MTKKQLPDLAQISTLSNDDLFLTRKTAQGTDNKVTIADAVESFGSPAVHGFTAISEADNKITLTPSNNAIVPKYYNGMRIGFISPIESNGSVQIKIVNLSYRNLELFTQNSTVVLKVGKYYEAVYVGNALDGTFRELERADAEVSNNEYVPESNNNGNKIELNTIGGVVKKNYYNGMSVKFIALYDSNSNVEISVDSLELKPLKNQYGQPVLLKAGQVVYAIFDASDNNSNNWYFKATILPSSKFIVAGTANNIELSTDDGFKLGSYYNGYLISFITTNVASTADVTINVDGLGAKPVLNVNGIALKFSANYPVLAMYKSGAFVLHNSDETPIEYVVNANLSTSDNIELSSVNALPKTGYYNGMIISFLPIATNTNNVTIKVDGLNAVQLINQSGGKVFLKANRRIEATFYQSDLNNPNTARFYTYVPEPKVYSLAGDSNDILLNTRSGLQDTSYYKYMPVEFIAEGDSTSDVTINVDNIGPVNLVDQHGANVRLTNGQIVRAIYKDAKFITSIFSSNVYTNEYLSVASSNIPQNYTLYTLTTAYGVQKSTYYKGMAVIFTADADCIIDGGLKINVDGLGDKDLQEKDSITSPIKEGELVFATYDGTKFIISKFTNRSSEAPPLDAYIDINDINSIPTTNKITINVGIGLTANYQSLEKAIQAVISEFGVSGGNRVVQIVLLPNYTWNETVRINSGLDLSWITITSNGERINFNPGLDKKWMIYGTNCTLPKFNNLNIFIQRLNVDNDGLISGSNYNIIVLNSTFEGGINYFPRGVSFFDIAGTSIGNVDIKNCNFNNIVFNISNNNNPILNIESSNFVIRTVSSSTIRMTGGKLWVYDSTFDCTNVATNGSNDLLITDFGTSIYLENINVINVKDSILPFRLSKTNGSLINCSVTRYQASTLGRAIQISNSQITLDGGDYRGYNQTVQNQNIVIVKGSRVVLTNNVQGGYQAASDSQVIT